MIDEARGRIDYQECGSGPTVVLVPGSCSTGSAWRPVIAAWNGRFRAVTTSLLGYGGTAERRTTADPWIAHEAAIVESVIDKADGRVHLVGHSFGGEVAVAVARRNRVPLVIEAPGAAMLRDQGEHCHYQAFRRMTDAYFAAYAGGDKEAIASMIDFYGGLGTFASWPLRVRAYAVETTPVNILDWASAYGSALPASSLAAVDLSALVLCGGLSHPAVQCANALLGRGLDGTFHTVNDASHFMITTHAAEVAGLVADHVGRSERGDRTDSDGSA